MTRVNLIPTGHECVVCAGSRHPLAYACKACKKILDRIDIRSKPDRDARLRALKAAWDGQHFRCFYTGWPLCIDNYRSPYFLTWEHRTPRNQQDIVVAAAIINDMKSDLTEGEFRDLVVGLSKRFAGSNEVVPLINPTPYRR
jgi:hypothetical protein